MQLRLRMLQMAEVCAVRSFSLVGRPSVDDQMLRCIILFGHRPSAPLHCVVLWRTLALTGARSCQAQRPSDAWCLSTTSPKPAFQQTDEYQRVKFAFRRTNLLLALLFRKSQPQKHKKNWSILVTSW